MSLKPKEIVCMLEPIFSCTLIRLCCSSYSNIVRTVKGYSSGQDVSAVEIHLFVQLFVGYYVFNVLNKFV